MVKARRVGHATFETPDLEKAITYYGEFMGLIVAEREKEFVKSLLHRRVPSPRHPALRNRVFFVIVFNAVLLIRSAMVSSVVQQVPRHVDDG